MRTSDVVIAGAGIIGLSAALEFAAHRHSVTVLDQGLAMREASWAAAGMLAAGDPENPPPLRPLAEFSRSLYPEFFLSLLSLSGALVPLRTHIALQGLHGGRLRQGVLGQNALGADALHALVPDLLTQGHSFIALEERSLDPRDLCHALPLAARAAGVLLLEQTAVRSVEQSGDRVRIETSRGEFSARDYLHCCGAWSAIAAGVPVEPRKGQIIAVTMPAGSPSLACVVRTPEIYLVPRGDGRIAVGATVERAGFDRTVTDQATKALLAAAAALWPPIREGVVIERWAGLRPATPDALPVLGAMILPDQPMPRMWLATGHFRNGILLAPGTARVLRNLVLGEQPTIDLQAFSAQRFTAVEAMP